MQQVTMGSDNVRTSWGATIDKAFAGTEVVVERHKRPVVSVVNHDWLQALKRRAGIMDGHLETAKSRLHKMMDDPSAVVSEEEYQQILTDAGLDE